MVYSFINNCWTKHNLIYPLKATSSPKAVHKFPEDEWLLQHTATSRRIRHSSSCHLFFPGSPLSCSTSQQQHQRKWFYSTKPTHSSLIIKEVVSTLTGGRHHHQLKKIMACNEKIPRNPPVHPWKYATPASRSCNIGYSNNSNLCSNRTNHLTFLLPALDFRTP